MAGFKINEYL